MSSTVADLFDAMAATYDDLEPWYEHFYARLHAILRAELGSARAAARALDAGCGPAQSAVSRPGLTAHGDLRPVCSPWLTALAVRRPRRPASSAAIRRRLLRRRGRCGGTQSFVDDPPRRCRAGRVLRPSIKLLLDCEHRPSLDSRGRWPAPSRAIPGYGVSARRVARVFARDGVRSYPATDCSALPRRADRLLTAAGLRPVRAWGLHGVATCCHPPLTVPGRRAVWPPPGPSGWTLTTTAPALAFANNLALLAIALNDVDLDLGRPPFTLTDGSGVNGTSLFRRASCH
jgi:hypothetical protein